MQTLELFYCQPTTPFGGFQPYPHQILQPSARLPIMILTAGTSARRMLPFSSHSLVRRNRLVQCDLRNPRDLRDRPRRDGAWSYPTTHLLRGQGHEAFCCNPTPLLCLIVPPRFAEGDIKACYCKFSGKWTSRVTGGWRTRGEMPASACHQPSQKLTRIVGKYMEITETGKQAILRAFWAANS